MQKWLLENAPYIIGVIVGLIIISILGYLIWDSERDRDLCQDSGYLALVPIFDDEYCVRVQDGQLIGVRLKELREQK